MGERWCGKKRVRTGLGLAIDSGGLYTTHVEEGTRVRKGEKWSDKNGSEDETKKLERADD